VELKAREVGTREEWNRAVESLPAYGLYQGYEWGEVRSTQGWRPRRLAVFAGNECVGAVSVLLKRPPLLRWSVGYCPGGPLLKEPSDGRAWQALLTSLGDLARAERTVFVRADRSVPGETDPLAAALREGGLQVLSDDWTTWNVPRIVMRMAVTGPEEDLRRALRRRFREYIASAPRRGLTVRPAGSLEEGLRFREALAAVGQRRGQPVRNRAYFERLWREYVRPGEGVLLLAEHDGQVVGGLLGARFGDKAYMLYVVVREKRGSLRLHQAPLLYWEFVRWARQAGCVQVDWGGIATHMPPREDDPGYGLYQFKRGFNASIEHLTAYHDLVFAPRRYSVFRLVERRLAAPAWTWRGHLNRAFDQAERAAESVRRKARQFGVGVRQRGLFRTMYWGGFGFLRPNRFHVLARDLTSGAEVPPSRDGAEIWEAAMMREYRRSRRGLPPEFYQDEIDGVELCSVVRVGEEVAGLIWIYRSEDASRLFRLREVEAELNNGFVLPAYRGRGIFKISIAYACDWLREEGYRTAYAMVHSKNAPSKAAFEGVGFHTVAAVRHFLLYRPAYSGATAPREADASP
jgi:lipid II:glycine glycyltransferase (peptidoglycan interpeptide bridge formation enzyme)/ribosomal protein S18 acetylase RimI-like enzyme